MGGAWREKLSDIHLIHLGQRWMQFDVSECRCHVFRMRRGYWISAFSPSFISFSFYLSIYLFTCLFISRIFHNRYDFSFGQALPRESRIDPN